MAGAVVVIAYIAWSQDEGKDTSAPSSAAGKQVAGGNADNDKLRQAQIPQRSVIENQSGAKNIGHKSAAAMLREKKSLK